MTALVRIGFVPSYRMRYTPWCQEMRDQSLASFTQLPGVEIVVPEEGPAGSEIDAERGYSPHGMICSLDQSEAMAEYFARQKVDGLIIGSLDFADERSAAKVAEKLAVPVLLYATKEPPAPDHHRLERVSDSYCGNLSVAAALHRRKIRFHFAGLFFPDEPAFLAEVDTFARAVAVVKGLRGTRIGQVGVRPVDFESVICDEAAMILSFGQNVIPIELAEVVWQATSYADDDPRVRAILVEQEDQLATITVHNSYRLKAAKLELALTEFWKSNRLSAMAVQCWPAIQRQLGISVCAVYGRLTARGMLTACETDILGALSMLTTYQAALGETVPHFIDWTIQHRENPNRLLAWHCGNAPVCLAADPRKPALRSRGDMKGEMPIPEDDSEAGLYQFQLRPGVVTFCRLVEYDGKWKMFISGGEIIPSEETLAGTWSWVEVKNHARLYRTLVEEGFVHHASMIHGDWTQALLQACKFLDIQPVFVP